MSWHSDQLSYALGLGGLFSFYTVVGVGVWLLGDKFDYDTSSRIIIIAIVLLTLPFALIIGFLVMRRRKKAEAKEAAAGAEAGAVAGDAAAAPQKLSAPSGKYEDISTSTEEAVQFLKNSNLGAGKDAVYALPWYLIAGTPKSGKTSLVLSSGLNFQNLPSQRQSEQKFIRPTRSVDWRVSSDAVFLDTAGRYQTEGVDQDEWASLLDTLKKYRGQRPLDGMILAVSAERILHADESEVEQMAKVLRTRLDEAIQRTKTRFPIYLIFTHADAIEGFRDSFSASHREGETLVWGATIPLDQTANAHALFDSEYELLQNSIMKRRLIRLSAPFAPVRQLKIFNFPLHFSTARGKLGSFVSTLFRPNPFSESPFLRGFYLTAVPVNRQPSKGLQTQVGQTVGQSYFSEKLFRDVILRDKDLVATIQAQKVRPPILGWLLTVLGALLVLTLLIFAAVSLVQNKRMLEDVGQKAAAIQTIYKADNGKDPLTKKPDEARSEVEAIDNLRKSLVDLDNNERTHSPLLMSFGFYSGNRIYHDYLLNIYLNAVEQRFKRPMVKRLEDDLRKFTASQPIANPAQPTKQEEDTLEKNYGLLQAYLMLTDKYKDKAEVTHLSKTLLDYWKSESKIPSDMDGVAQQQLDFWAKQVDRSEFPTITPDNNLIEASRKKLQAFPAVFRYYKRVTTEISKKVPAVKVESLLVGTSGAGLIDGSYPVEGAYTIEGYQKYMKDAIAKASQELTKDDWVMGEELGKAQTQGTETQRLQEKYFADYADNWIKFVRGINIKPYKNKADATDALKQFGKVESPMAVLVKAIKQQTNLSAKPNLGWWDWLKSFIPSGSGTTEMAGETTVDKAFRGLVTFVGTDDKAPITKYSQSFQALSGKLETSPSDIKKISEDLANENDKIGIGKARKDVNTTLEPFTDENMAGPDLANLLRKPLDNLDALLGEVGINQIKQAWTDALLPKAKDAEKGYPYDDTADADLTKLTAYLNPVDGTLSTFYKEKLEKYFDVAGGQLKPKENAPKFSQEFVDYLNNAFRLRDALFGKNAKPQFSYDFALQKTSDATLDIKIDNETFNASGNASKTMTFPSSSGDSSVTIGSSASTDTNSSANPPAPSVTPTGNTNSATNSNSSSQAASSTRFTGPWGLFKFVDNGKPAKQPGGEYLLTYKIGAKNLSATIKSSGGDLFDRGIFRNARAPQTLVKP